ncbi:MAG: hypothetical protein ACLUR5_17130 [Eubacterium ventriosum]
MARNDDGMYHNFRLSRRNPIHIRINEILSDLNKDVYQFKEPVYCGCFGVLYQRIGK